MLFRPVAMRSAGPLTVKSTSSPIPAEVPVAESLGRMLGEVYGYAYGYAYGFATLIYHQTILILCCFCRDGASLTRL